MNERAKERKSNQTQQIQANKKLAQVNWDKWQIGAWQPFHGDSANLKHVHFGVFLVGLASKLLAVPSCTLASAVDRWTLGWVRLQIDSLPWCCPIDGQVDTINVIGIPDRTMQILNLSEPSKFAVWAKLGLDKVQLLVPTLELGKFRTRKEPKFWS